MPHSLSMARRRWVLVVIVAAGIACALDIADSRPASAATIAVTTTADELNSDGDCSLREAIQAANTDAIVDACPAGSGADTIQLAIATYSLAIAGPGEDANVTGDLDVTEDLTISGLVDHGTGESTTIDGAGLDRVFDIDPGGVGVTAHLSGLDIRNGMVGDSGGGLFNRSSAFTSLSFTAVTGNSAAMKGGGIFNAGVLTSFASRIHQNSASEGGGIMNGAGGNVTLGGFDSVAFNTAESSGGGIYNGSSATMNVNDSGFHDNSAGSLGGGIFNSGVLTGDGSYVSDNSAREGGGIMNFGTATLSGAGVTNNTAQTVGGGAANALGKTLKLTSSIIAGNSSSDGGGIANFGTLTLADSAISDNGALFLGGGISNANTASFTLEGSIVARNTAGQSTSGGISNNGTTAKVNVTNSTVSGNSGGISNHGPGGSITLTNVTVNDSLYAFAGSVGLQNTIITNPVGPDCDFANTTIISGGYNMVSDGTCALGGTGDSNDTNPLIGLLLDNGGLTRTHALLLGSSATDVVPLSNCVLSADQRGVSRPQGAKCDIGAYEGSVEEPPPEMILNVAGGNCDEVTRPTTCDVPVGEKFTLAVEILVAPPQGYFIAQSFIHYGDDLIYNPAAQAADEIAWPDCDPASAVRAQFDNTNLGLDPTGYTVNHGCLTETEKPLPVSTYVGDFVQISMTCSGAESSTDVVQLPYDASTLPPSPSPPLLATVQVTSGSVFAFYSGFVRIDVVPNLSDLTINCVAPPPNPRMQKSPSLQNVWLTRQGSKVPPTDCLAGTDIGTLTEQLNQAITSQDPKDPSAVQQIAAFEFEVLYNNKKVCVDLTTGADWVTAGAICIIEDSASKPQLEGVARIGCVTQKGAPAIDNLAALARIDVYPQPELYSQMKPNQDNGVVVQINNVNCDLGDEQGHAIPIFACDDADITFRYLEGDVEPDCSVDAVDAQAIAFRWGVEKGSLIYNDFMNLEPSGAQQDEDIDINDLQFVFGRFGSTCAGPNPPQPPVNPKA